MKTGLFALTYLRITEIKCFSYLNHPAAVDCCNALNENEMTQRKRFYSLYFLLFSVFNFKFTYKQGSNYTVALGGALFPVRTTTIQVTCMRIFVHKCSQ